MHCQISIFELKMMVKIGVIFMPFLNPTYHFRGTADFTDCTDYTTDMDIGNTAANIRPRDADAEQNTSLSPI